MSNDLPREIPDVSAQAAADELRRLQAEKQQAGTERVRLERARNGAVEADREAYAAALRGGKKEDPGTSATEKADKAIAKARRREEALGTACGQARAEFDAVVSDHLDELQRIAEERVSESRVSFGRVLESLVEEHRRLALAIGLAGWLKAFPQGRAPGKFAPRLSALADRSGETPSFEQVAEALAALAEPPKPAAHAAGTMPRP